MPVDFNLLTKKAEAHRLAEEFKFDTPGQFRFGVLIDIDTRIADSKKSSWRGRVGTAKFQDPQSGDYFDYSIFNIWDALKAFQAESGDMFLLKAHAIKGIDDAKFDRTELLRVNTETNELVSAPGRGVAEQPQEAPEHFEKIAEKARDRAASTPPQDVINLDDLDDDQYFGPPDGGPEKTVTVDVIPPAERVAVGATADPDEG